MLRVDLILFILFLIRKLIAKKKIPNLMYGIVLVSDKLTLLEKIAESNSKK